MTFIIPPEELTTEGPYCLGEPRPLSFMEIAYTELMLQMELLKDVEQDLTLHLDPAQTVDDLQDSASMNALLRHPGPANLARTATPLVQPVPLAPNAEAALGAQEVQ